MGHKVGFVFANRSSHVVKAGDISGTTVTAAAPLVNANYFSIGLDGVDRVTEQSGS
jgi:hypothetical protein